MHIDTQSMREAVKVMERDALAPGLDVGYRRSRQPDGLANLRLVQTEPLSMSPHKLSELRIEF